MLGVDEARDRVLDAVAALPVESVPLTEALGRVLAGDVSAEADLPPFANAAMDGFAVRSADTTGASRETPVRLGVVGQVAAGIIPDAVVESGTAVRIMTGARLPVGADAVVRFEETDEADGLGPRTRAVEIRVAVRPGEHVRLPGEDVRAGALVLRPGSRLRPPEIGLLAALGWARVTVHRRPKVGIIATGDELCPPGQTPRPGQIPDSNGPMIAAYAAACGGLAVRLGIARDEPADLRARLAAAGDVDLLLTTGGVSVGDYDVVKDVLREDGRIELWRVRLKPGKPLAFGRIGGRPLIGLPGNPVAAAVAFVLFARPAILRLLGWPRTDLDLPTVEARLLDRIENRGDRRTYARVVVQRGATGWEARLAGPPGAGAISGLAAANGLLVVPEETAVAEPGGIYPVLMLDWNWGIQPATG
jgi:molybdopterin molybdotransferase